MISLCSLESAAKWNVSARAYAHSHTILPSRKRSLVSALILCPPVSLLLLICKKSGSLSNPTHSCMFFLHVVYISKQLQACGCGPGRAPGSHVCAGLLHCNPLRSHKTPCWTGRRLSLQTRKTELLGFKHVLVHYSFKKFIGFHCAIEISQDSLSKCGSFYEILQLFSPSGHTVHCASCVD